MSTLLRRRGFSGWLVLGIVVASLVFAMPWARPFGRSIAPELTRYAVIVATIVGLVHLVNAAVEGFGRRGGWNAAALPIVLGTSALLSAQAFLPAREESVPRLLPLIGAALFAIAAAVLQRRLREREEC